MACWGLNLGVLTLKVFGGLRIFSGFGFRVEGLKPCLVESVRFKLFERSRLGSRDPGCAFRI